MNIPEISVQDYQNLKNDQVEHVLIDVREDDEYKQYKIDGSIHITLGNIPESIKTLDKNKRYIIQCRKGGRSAQATTFMISEGFKQVENLVGGIEAWIKDIAPS